MNLAENRRAPRFIACHVNRGIYGRGITQHALLPFGRLSATMAGVLVELGVNFAADC